MMKNLQISVLTFALIFLGITRTAEAQNPFWTFPDQYFSQPLSTVGNLPIANTTAKYTHAGLMDPYGELMFYKVDNINYSGPLGEPQSYLANPYFPYYPVTGSAEALIVPQPGRCDRFYIFQSTDGDSFNDELPHYSIFEYYHGDQPGMLLPFGLSLETAVMDEG